MNKNKIILAGFFLLFSLLAASCKNPIIEQIWGLKIITFDSNGGSYVSSQNLLKGKTAERPVDPVRTSYLFFGWYQDNNTFSSEWDFNEIPSQDITLYARWIIEDIPLAAVTVTAPQTYVFPNREAIGTGNFSTGDAEWTPIDSPFMPETSYTVSVTLTAHENYIFTTDTVALINRNPAEITVSANGFTAVLTYQFPPTEPAQITLTVEQITERAPLPIDNIILSQTGNGYSTSIEISVNEAHFDPDSIVWRITGVGVHAGIVVTETGPSFILDATDIRYNALGGNMLRLTVSIAGIPYQANIRFTIVE